MIHPARPPLASFALLLVASARRNSQRIHEPPPKVATPGRHFYNPEREDPPTSGTGVSSEAERGLPGCQTPEVDSEASANRGAAHRRKKLRGPACSAVRSKVATRRQVVAPACSGSAAGMQTIYSVGYAERHVQAGRAAKKGVSRDGAHPARVRARHGFDVGEGAELMHGSGGLRRSEQCGQTSTCGHHASGGSTAEDGGLTSSTCATPMVRVPSNRRTPWKDTGARGGLRRPRGIASCSQSMPGRKAKGKAAIRADSGEELTRGGREFDSPRVHSIIGGVTCHTRTQNRSAGIKLVGEPSAVVSGCARTVPASIAAVGNSPKSITSTRRRRYRTRSGRGRRSAASPNSRSVWCGVGRATNGRRDRTWGLLHAERAPATGEAVGASIAVGPTGKTLAPTGLPRASRFGAEGQPDRLHFNDQERAGRRDFGGRCSQAPYDLIPEESRERPRVHSSRGRGHGSADCGISTAASDSLPRPFTSRRAP